jgi:two-component system, cell cycle response regulator DivK
MVCQFKKLCSSNENALESWIMGYILIVEDEVYNRKLFRVLFENKGYFVIEAADGRRAVELAIREKPDLILMDIGLPVMDGLQAAAAIKNNAVTSNIPVIAITGFVLEGKNEEIYKAVCDGYFTKPVDVKVLLRSVEQWIQNKIQVPISGREDVEPTNFEC